MNHSDLETVGSRTQRSRSLRPSAAGYVLAALTVAAAILRLIFLNSKSFWLDEGFTASLAAEPFVNLLIEIFHGQMAVYMAAYFALMHCWSLIAGSSEISLRLPSVVFATATVPLIYALGAELCDRRVGLIAALLLCVNVSAIWYGQEARSYAMLEMLVTLSTLLFVRSIKLSSAARCAAYLIAGSVCTYAHLFGILILPVQLLSLFLFRVDRRTRLRLTACIALAGILSLPPIILSILGDRGQVSWIPATSANAVLRVFAVFAGVYWDDMRRLSWPLFALYIGAIGIAVARPSQRERPLVGFLLLSVVLPIGIALVVSIFKPLFLTRYLLICLPFFVLLAAIGLARIRSRAVMVVVTVSIVALSLSQDHDFYQSPGMQDWRGAINFLATNAKSGDVLLVFPFWYEDPVEYYAGRLDRPAEFRVITDRLHSLDGKRGDSDHQVYNLRRFLAACGVNSYTRVWILTTLDHRKEPALRGLEIGHQVIAGPDLTGLFLARLDQL